MSNCALAADTSLMWPLLACSYVKRAMHGTRMLTWAEIRQVRCWMAVDGAVDCR